MKTKQLFGLGLMVLSLSVLQSCTKIEGEGGTSKIKGVVIEQKYNSVGNVIAEYPAMDQDVYIIYGAENTFHNDDVKTSFDGSYEFNYLQNGSYQIYAYEDCNTCASGQKVVQVDVEISDKKSTVEVDTIYIKKY